MNKKFSTLLAGAVLAMASVSASAQVNTAVTSVAYGSSVKADTYYQILSGSKFLQVTKHTDGADSVKVVTLPAVSDENYFETLDSALWSVAKTTIAVANETAYTA